MKPLTEGMRGMIDYVSPLVDKRIVNPGDDFISVLARGEKQGVFTRHQVLVNTSLLLLAGHETTINLLCNGTLSFMRHPDQWELLKQDPAGRAKPATEECLRYDSPVDVDPADRDAGRRDARQGAAQERSHALVHFVGQSRSRGVRRTRTRSTSPGIRTSMSRSARARITASARRWRGSRVRRCSRRWRSASPNLRLETEDLEYQPSITFRSLKSLPVTWH